MSFINRLFLISMFGCFLIALMMFTWNADNVITNWSTDTIATIDGIPYTVEWLHISPISNQFWNIFRSLDDYFSVWENIANPFRYMTIPQIPLMTNANGFEFVINLLAMFVNGLSSLLNVVIGGLNFINHAIRMISQFFFTLAAFVGFNING